jgi:hypothetical protein
MNQPPRLDSLNTKCPLDSHRLRTYLFNNYYLRYFTAQVAEQAKRGLRQLPN